MIVKPKALKPGDKVAIIAPSTPTDPERLQRAEVNFRSLGLEPVLYPSCYKSHGHLAGLDRERAQDINDAFANPEIQGVICMKGGAGAYRLLPLIDYEIVRANPKVFVGYSDITALHMAFNKLCRMVTYHGPMFISDLFLSENSMEPYTLASYKQALFGTEAGGRLDNPPGHEMTALVEGHAEGELIGGNLSLLVSTLGSPWELDVQGKILFIEEVGEAAYRVDRMLNSLALAGKFRDCAGVILGTWSNCRSEKKGGYSGHDLPLQTIFDEIIKPFNKPTIQNLWAGHNYPTPTLAFGTQVRIDTSGPEVVFLEAGNR
jgi:muramoyltetrapeptide carboxypeptidase